MTHIADAEIVHDPSDVPDGEPVAIMRQEPTTAPEQIRQSALASSLESIDSLFRLAVQNRTPAAELRELMALHRETRQELARQAYFAALAAFQEEVEPVVRKRKADVATRDGGNMKYSFANVDDVAAVVRPTLIKHGLSYKWDQKLDGGNCTILTTVMHIGGHAETSSFTVPTESRAGMSPQQKVGAAMSYGQARGLGIALGITTTDAEPDAIDPTPVTDAQLDEIQTAIEKHEVPVERFLKALEVTKAGDIRKVDFMRALQLIDDFVERKAAKAKKGGGQ